MKKRRAEQEVMAFVYVIIRAYICVKHTTLPMLLNFNASRKRAAQRTHMGPMMKK